MSVVLSAYSPLGPDGGAPEQGGVAPPVRAVPEQIWLNVDVGNFWVDASVCAHRPLSVVMEELVPFLVSTLKEEGLAVEFDNHAVYSLAFEGGMPFPRTMSLADAGVVDGNRLILREVHSNEVFKPIIEDPADALAEFNAAKFAAFTRVTARVLGLAALVTGAGAVAGLLLAGWWSTPSLVWWFPPAAALMVVCLMGTVVAQRRKATQISYALGLAALPLAMVAGWVAVPAYDGVAGNWTPANVLAGVATVAAASLVTVWLTGVGRTLHTVVITLSLAAVAAAAVLTFTGFDGRQVAAGALLVGAILAAFGQAYALILARVRPPSLPPPGEGLDRRELEEAALTVVVSDDPSGVRLVELDSSEDTSLERRSRDSKKLLTGLFVAAAVIVTTAAIAVVQPRTHYYYWEIALAVVTALVLALKARSLNDRVHAVVFFLGAYIVAAGVAFTVVTGTANPVVQLSVAGGSVLVVILATLGGLRLPGAKISELTQRRIENLEFLLIMSSPVLMVYVSGAFAAMRNLIGH